MTPKDFLTPEKAARCDMLEALSKKRALTKTEMREIGALVLEAATLCKAIPPREVAKIMRIANSI